VSLMSIAVGVIRNTSSPSSNPKMCRYAQYPNPPSLGRQYPPMPGPGKMMFQAWDFALLMLKDVRPEEAPPVCPAPRHSGRLRPRQFAGASRRANCFSLPPRTKAAPLAGPVRTIITSCKRSVPWKLCARAKPQAATRNLAGPRPSLLALNSMNLTGSDGSLGLIWDFW
jgi:hypothetical protein